MNVANIAMSSTITVSSQFDDWTKDNLVDGVSLLNETPDDHRERNRCFHSEVSPCLVRDQQSKLVPIVKSMLWMGAVTGITASSCHHWLIGEMVWARLKPENIKRCLKIYLQQINQSNH